MSRTLLVKEDVPKYIKEIVQRLSFVKGYDFENVIKNRNDEQSIWDYTPGYTFILYGRRKIGAEIGSRKDAEKLVKWAKKYYADAEILQEHMWYNDVEPLANDYPMTKWHKQKAYREHFRNYWIIRITDPVCLRFERDNFYR